MHELSTSDLPILSSYTEPTNLCGNPIRTESGQLHIVLEIKRATMLIYDAHRSNNSMLAVDRDQVVRPIVEFVDAFVPELLSVERTP
jgi:hypothetical protein